MKTRELTKLKEIVSKQIVVNEGIEPEGKGLVKAREQARKDGYLTALKETLETIEALEKA
jgi:hypothetical protein